ncbi:MAG TPA: Fic family protein [Patescibacteria group bacterium]|nr:Fic family protein [Patescibacteria group bacterium]
MIVRIESEGNRLPENENKKDSVSALCRAHLARQYSISVAKKFNLPAFETIVKNLNLRLVSKEELKGRLDAVAGEYRTKNVFMPISPVSPPQPEDVPYLMKKLGVASDEKIKAIDCKKVAGIEIGKILETMSFTHYWMARIHPFREGNGRDARETNALLSIRTGLPIIIIGPVDRDEYIKTLNTIHFYTYLNDKLEADLKPLTLFLGRRMLRSFPNSNLSKPQMVQREKLISYISKLDSDIK